MFKKEHSSESLGSYKLPKFTGKSTNKYYNIIKQMKYLIIFNV